MQSRGNQIDRLPRRGQRPGVLCQMMRRNAYYLAFVHLASIFCSLYRIVTFSNAAVPLSVVTKPGSVGVLEAAVTACVGPDSSSCAFFCCGWGKR